MNKVDRLDLLFREALDTYRAKNADYGDSFAKSIEKFGIVAAVVRMNDKMERINCLTDSKNKARVKDESIRDTLMDLGNYCFMTVMEMDLAQDGAYDYTFDMYVDEFENADDDYTEGRKLNI